MDKAISEKINQGIKQVILCGNPLYILINPVVFLSIAKTERLIGNGGRVAYSTSIDLNEVAREDLKWDESLYKEFHLEFVVSTRIDSFEVIADPFAEAEMSI